MYYPKDSGEPSGCMQTLVITRVVFGLLALPVAIITGAMLLLSMTFFLYTVNAPLALIPLGILVGSGYVYYRIEQAGIARQMGPPEEPK